MYNADSIEVFLRFPDGTGRILAVEHALTILQVKQLIAANFSGFIEPQHIFLRVNVRDLDDERTVGFYTSNGPLYPMTCVQVCKLHCDEQCHTCGSLQLCHDDSLQQVASSASRRRVSPVRSVASKLKRLTRDLTDNLTEHLKVL